jgi:transposase
MAWRRLTRQQWAAIGVHLPQPKATSRGGRPRVEDRRCLEGILWVLWTGAQWSELPRRYSSPSTCWRRLYSGKRRGCCSSSGGPSRPNSMTRRSSAGMHALLMGALSPPKKGGQGRQDETRQGDQVDGSGQWRGDLRWEHTWRRLPRRKSRSSKRPSTRSPSGAPANPAGLGSAPTA